MFDFYYNRRKKVHRWLEFFVKAAVVVSILKLAWM